MAETKTRPATMAPDHAKMVLLVSLYFLQGLPMGLIFGSLPLLLKAAPGTTYSDLAIMSLSSYPYSLKLLWSPIVDSVFSNRIGRRRSWIVPAQAISAAGFFLLALRMPEWIDAGPGRIIPLTTCCLALITLAATQDIALDGWALSMLSAPNKGYASTCQSLGLTPGFFVSYTIFLALNDTAFAQAYFARDKPFLSLQAFLNIIGLLYTAMTLVVLLFTSEPPNRNNDAPTVVYRQLYDVIRLPAVLSLVSVLLISRATFSAHESVTQYMLMENGLLRQDISLMQLLQLPFDIVGTIVAGRLASRGKPMELFLAGWKARYVFACCFPLLVYFFPQQPSKPVYWMYFTLLFLVRILYQFAGDSLMFVAMGTFFNQIADVSIGGSYLTLLNTISNFATTWPKFFVLASVEHLALRRCSADADPGIECPVYINGYYIASVMCLISGFFVHRYMQSRISRLSRFPSSAWRTKRGGD